MQQSDRHISLQFHYRNKRNQFGMSVLSGSFSCQKGIAESQARSMQIVADKFQFNSMASVTLSITPIKFAG